MQKTGKESGDARLAERKSGNYGTMNCLDCGACEIMIFKLILRHFQIF